MRASGSLSIVCLCLVLIASASVAQAMEVNINFLLAGKSLDDDDWGTSAVGVDATSQPAFGIETTFGGVDWPVAIALDYLGSAHYEDVVVANPVPLKVDLVQATWEFDFGVRKIWKPGKIRPYVGGGLGFIGAYQDLAVGIGQLTIDDADVAPGVWLNGGVFWRLGPKFNIGFDLRLSSAKADLFGRSVQAGGATFGMLLGWGWGGGGP